MRRFVRLPAVDVPDFNFDDHPEKISNTDIEQAATQLRRHWKLGDGPISNVVWLVENHGVIVSRGETQAADIDAYSEWAQGEERPYIFLGSEKESAVRSRFDVSHELGHLILHRHVADRTINNPTYHRLLEDQAHRFAGAFLLPQASFLAGTYAPTLERFRSLKRTWRVSIATMVHRSRDLGMISDEQERALWISMSRRHWRQSEPLDDELEPEQPRLLQRAFELMIDSGAQSKAEVRAALPLSSQDIEELVGLPRGYLDDLQPAIKVIGFRERVPQRLQAGDADDAARS